MWPLRREFVEELVDLPDAPERGQGQRFLPERSEVARVQSPLESGGLELPLMVSQRVVRRGQPIEVVRPVAQRTAVGMQSQENRNRLTRAVDEERVSPEVSRHQL